MTMFMMYQCRGDITVDKMRLPYDSFDYDNTCTGLTMFGYVVCRQTPCISLTKSPNLKWFLSRLAVVLALSIKAGVESRIKM